LPHLPPPVLGLFANSNEEVTRMLSKSAVIAVLTLSAGLFLAPVANAETFKGTFSSKCTDVSINGLLSFNGSTTSSEAMVTCSIKSIFPKKPILGGDSDLQGVSEFSILGASCTFTGAFGEAESGVTTSVVGALYAQDGLSGSLFYSNTLGSGCLSLTTGAYMLTETTAIFGGIGAFKGATGTGSFTLKGFTLGPAPAKGAFGFFQWARGNGKITVTLP
jgi:hypothetical protein